ncbi:MAG: GNAT family N-acetyltransferase [Bacteroidales bacterium]|nr:GNAT family N-acetyltransferase [Bacteroidales bacterium]
MMETDRILLRPWYEEDADTLFLYASNPVIGNRAGWPPHKSPDESLEIIRTVFHNDTTWAIENKENHRPIGCIGYMPTFDLKLPTQEGDVLIGYWIGQPYWNQGFCTEALRLMIEYIKTTTHIPSLISSHYIDNPASGRVMEKCGFIDIGQTIIENNNQQQGKMVRVLRLELRR